MGYLLLTKHFHYEVGTVIIGSIVEQGQSTAKGIRTASTLDRDCLQSVTLPTQLLVFFIIGSGPPLSKDFSSLEKILEPSAERKKNPSWMFKLKYN